MLALDYWQVSPAAAMTFLLWLTHLPSSCGEQQSCPQSPSISQELACASPQNSPLQKLNFPGGADVLGLTPSSGSPARVGDSVAAPCCSLAQERIFSLAASAPITRYWQRTFDI